MTTIVVTWMDRTQETYHVDSWRSEGDILSFTDRSRPHGQEAYSEIPLNNVKIFRVER